LVGPVPAIIAIVGVVAVFMPAPNAAVRPAACVDAGSPAGERVQFSRGLKKLPVERYASTARAGSIATPRYYTRSVASVGIDWFIIATPRGACHRTAVPDHPETTVHD
jgi:hypothetical protein